VHKVCSDLAQGLEDEAPLVQARVRHDEIRLLEARVVVEEQVEVECARRPALGAALATRLRLDRVQELEELSRPKARAQAGRGIEVAPLGWPERLGLVADARALSLKELVDQLQDKHHRLASSPAIWPAKGWLTSHFGPRISPFTGRRQFHAGIDIAGARGTQVVAPARGRVEFVGTKGPLGNLVLIDHGFGIRTQYGHNDKLLVKRGEVVERGQSIALVGNSGRSTGPHLHYTVEVNGKAVDPIDYIFD